MPSWAHISKAARRLERGRFARTPRLPATKAAAASTRQRISLAHWRDRSNRQFARDQTSFGHQRKGPDRAAGRYFARRVACRKNAAESRRYGHILNTFMCIGDGRRINAGAGLELPKRFT